MQLTKRQFEILRIVDLLCAKGFAPSVEEIAEAAGLSSLGTVHKHLENLQRKGAVTRDYNRSRSIEVTGLGIRHLHKQTGDRPARKNIGHTEGMIITIPQTVIVERSAKRQVCPNCQEVLVA